MQVVWATLYCNPKLLKVNRFQLRYNYRILPVLESCLKKPEEVNIAIFNSMGRMLVFSMV
jgi:hypothetical protein